MTGQTVYLAESVLLQTQALSTFIVTEFTYCGLLYNKVMQTSFLSRCASYLEQFTCRTQNWFWLAGRF